MVSTGAHPGRFFFFFNDTATTEIYTLSLHDALPIFLAEPTPGGVPVAMTSPGRSVMMLRSEEHTSEPSHLVISYAVFCLKKKTNTIRFTDVLPKTRSGKIMRRLLKESATSGVAKRAT